VTDPLNRLLVEHTSAVRRNRPGETHRLVPIGGQQGGELLDWVEETGAFKVWRAKPNPGPTEDPYQSQPRTSGTFATIGRGHRLVWLASQLGLWDEGSVLDWVPDSGGRIFGLDRSITSGDPMPQVLNISQFTIPPERELIYLDHERMLDWDRSTGDIIVWEYDRSATTTDPLPTLLNSTSFPNVLADHQIVYLGGDMLLIWNENSGDVEVWRYDRTILGEVDPFPDLEMSDSWAGEIDPGRQILYLGADQVLDWDPASGSHRIWSFDRPRMPAARFGVLLDSTWTPPRAGWPAHRSGSSPSRSHSPEAGPTPTSRPPMTRCAPTSTPATTRRGCSSPWAPSSTCTSASSTDSRPARARSRRSRRRRRSPTWAACATTPVATAAKGRSAGSHPRTVSTTRSAILHATAPAPGCAQRS
jgi:hypothetical protein